MKQRCETKHGRQNQTTTNRLESMAISFFFLHHPSIWNVCVLHKHPAPVRLHVHRLSKIHSDLNWEKWGQRVRGIGRLCSRTLLLSVRPHSQSRHCLLRPLLFRSPPSVAKKVFVYVSKNNYYRICLQAFGGTNAVTEVQNNLTQSCCIFSRFFWHGLTLRGAPGIAYFEHQAWRSCV